MIIRFTVPGPIKGKGRHRSVAFTRSDGSLGTRAYPEAKTRNYENWISMCAIEAGVKMSTYTGPVMLRAIFRLAVPMSRKRKLKEGDAHTQHPDLDNCQKSLLDGLNRVAWHDDSQVTLMHVAKVWTHNEPGVEVEIEYVEDDHGKPESVPERATLRSPLLS